MNQDLCVQHNCSLIQHIYVVPWVSSVLTSEESEVKKPVFLYLSVKGYKRRKEGRREEKKEVRKEEIKEGKEGRKQRKEGSWILETEAEARCSRCSMPLRI